VRARQSRWHDGLRGDAPLEDAPRRQQGTVYLVDRDKLGGTLDARPPCDVTSLPPPASDMSLFGPDVRGYFQPPSRGPLSVFGPFSDRPGDNALDRAKMRTAPAFFRDAAGASWLFVSGNSRAQRDLDAPTAPSLARLRVVTVAGQAASLALDANAPDVVFVNPGPPVVTSDHGRGAVIWVLDENGRRTEPLVPPPGKPAPPLPVLYAFDATTLALLWKQPLPTPGGKYNHPTIAHGTVYVGTDRLYAFRAR
jgi:hypothetical protein